jgi:hypothetical protein
VENGSRRFNLSEILECKRLGKTEWGFIFYQDDDYRQSIDYDSSFVVVEKWFDNKWQCASSYLINQRNKNRVEGFLNDTN